MLEASAAFQTAGDECNARKPHTKPNTWSTAGEECWHSDEQQRWTNKEWSKTQLIQKDQQILKSQNVQIHLTRLSAKLKKKKKVIIEKARSRKYHSGPCFSFCFHSKNENTFHQSQKQLSLETITSQISHYKRHKLWSLCSKTDSCADQVESNWEANKTTASEKSSHKGKRKTT